MKIANSKKYEAATKMEEGGLDMRNYCFQFSLGVAVTCTDYSTYKQIFNYLCNTNFKFEINRAF